MPDSELTAMQSIADALNQLEPEARDRVIRWSAERFGVSLMAPSGGRGAGQHGEGGAQAEFDQTLTEFVDLLDAVGPKTDVERALTGAYWLQAIQGAQSWPSQSVNNLLKDTGNGISNVTASLAKAQGRKPALVRQVSKSGRTAQARKQYKLTTAGLALIRAALVGTNRDDAEE